MKVLGTMGRRDAYIVSINHTELEKFLGLYYGKLDELHIGQEIDLGKGHDHASEIAHAMRQTQEFVKANQQVVTAILNGLRIEQIVANAPETRKEGVSA